MFRSRPIFSATKFINIARIVIAVCALMMLSAAAANAQIAPAPDGNGISVTSSPQVFAVMCAMDAAGYDGNSETMTSRPALAALHTAMQNEHGPAAEALRAFYRDHALSGSGETLSRYIAFALVVGPPPDFRPQMSHDLLPPEVLQIDGFQQILVNFYQEAKIERLWNQFENAYDQLGNQYNAPTRRIVQGANGYLRELLKPRGRTFVVYVEPMVGASTFFRNTGDQYSLVIGANADLPEDTIRHAYLHFLLDPLTLQYRKEIGEKSALLNIAAKAPALPVEYRDDFFSLMDECVVQAVELRLRSLPADQLETALHNADNAGFVLVRPLMQQLKKFEASEPSFSNYFPDLVKGIDVGAEQVRLQNYNFPVAAAVATPDEANNAAAEGKSEVEVWLAEGDRQLAAQNAAGATQTFEKVLEKYPNQPRAMYGLAIASVLSSKGDRAEQLFTSIVSNHEPAPDSTTLAWSHVYLGRIHDMQQDRPRALSDYRAALGVQGAPDAAKAAAQNGMQAPYAPRARAN